MIRILLLSLLLSPGAALADPTWDPLHQKLWEAGLKNERRALIAESEAQKLREQLAARREPWIHISKDAGLWKIVLPLLLGAGAGVAVTVAIK